MKKGFVLLTVMVIAAVLLAGCASTGPSSSMPEGTSSTLTVLVTDAPSYVVENVTVYFDRVEVHKAAEDPDGQGVWEEISLVQDVEDQTFFEDEGIRKIDLNADMGEVVLAQSQVDVGVKYTQIRVYMYADEENENHPVEVTYHEDIDGEAGESQTVPAKLPSGTLKFVRPFVVEEGETSILLDFDLQKSVVFTGNFDKDPNPNKPDKPNVIVKPVVKLQVTSSGAECELDGELTLENKNPDSDWAIIDDDIFGELHYSTEGEEFCYDFQGFGLDDIEYSLIYYADTEDRFNDWGGDNHGALIATGTAVDGILTLSGSVYLGMDLPHPNDANGYFYDYTLLPDSYDNATGAKIWLVPSECYDAEDPAPIYKVITWEPARFLFETDLINYEYTDVTAPAIPSGLVATPGDGEVSLDWDDNGEADLKEYNVYRADVDGGPYTKIATVTDSEYTDTGLANGTDYYYVVTAVDESDNESGNSDQVLATPAS
ncbi:hypothetical protein ES702_02385 [subsurface metagenome]